VNAAAGGSDVAVAEMGAVFAVLDHSDHDVDLAPVDHRQERLDAARKTIDLTRHEISAIKLSRDETLGPSPGGGNRVNYGYRYKIHQFYR
jgi:hypothetical protein